jgi:hypothetical protein
MGIRALHTSSPPLFWVMSVAQWEFAYKGFRGVLEGAENLWLGQSLGEFLGRMRGATKFESFSGKSNDVCNH